MTREAIADGLAVLVLQLANDRQVPKGWEPHEWAYVKGVASGEILRLREKLSGGDLPRGTSQTSGEMSQT